jgi:hypothetical protein
LSVLRRLYILGAALVTLFTLAVPTTGSAATTPSSVPLNTPWGAWKDCGEAYPGENCAIVQTTADNPSSHTLFLAGSFTELTSPGTGATAAYQNLAAVDDRTGTLVSGFQPHTFNGMIYAAAVDLAANLLYVGGDFTDVDGSAVAADHVAAFDMTTGARAAGFDVQANASVRALVYDGSTHLLYLGGRFSTVQAQDRQRLAAVDPVNGAVSATFVPPAISWTESPTTGSPADVRALTIGADQSGRRMLYVGGHFDTVAAVRHQSLIRVDAATGTLDTGYTPAIDATANDPLQAVDKIIWLDGSQDGIPGLIVAQAGHTNRAYRFGIAGRIRWYLKPNGDAQTAALYGGVVYLGGHFRCVAGGDAVSTCFGDRVGTVATRVHISAVSLASGAILPDFTPQLNPRTQPYYFGVWNLRITAGGTLWATGVFKAVTYAGKTYDRPKVAAFTV